MVILYRTMIFWLRSGATIASKIWFAQISF